MTVDRAALERAGAELGLRLPARVAISGTLRWQGVYRGVVDGVHRITINAGAEAPDEVLWHELTHAAQRERYRSGAAYDVAYGRQWEAAEITVAGLLDGDPGVLERFYRMPFEREALIAQRRAAERPLTVR